MMLSIIWISLAGVAAQPADAYGPGREVVAAIGKIVTPNGVEDSFEVTLGEARQIVNVRGADRGNPILLFVHGGPASVEMPIAWSFQRHWEDYFTVVQWDQRGAGRSYPLNDPKTLAPTLKLERYRDDAIELIELLRTKYGKRKIVLLGHSWGSIVGLSVAAARPDLLHAYVGVGQVIDFRENERVGFELVLAQARKDRNAAAVSELEALRPYPGPGPFDLKKLEIERQWSVHYGGLAAYRPNADFYFAAARISPEYSAADRKAWNDGSAFTMTSLFPQLADISFAQLSAIKVPVFMFLGRHDTTTPSPLAAAWLARLRAPRKATIWFEHSAHLPMIEEPGRMLSALVGTVRPVVQEPGAAK